MALDPIIDPRNFKILGWRVDERGHSEKRVLLVEDVRRMTDDGLMVDNEESLVLPEELVRLKETLAAKWTLIGKPVKTKRQKLGKVTDYSYNDGMFVQKLYVSVPIVKMLSSTHTLLIDRNQIIEVTDHYIMVRDVEVTEGAEMPAAVPA
jgi:uncharacterized protein YrrD